jgi:hypothetical protein
MKFENVYMTILSSILCREKNQTMFCYLGLTTVTRKIWVSVHYGIFGVVKVCLQLRSRRADMFNFQLIQPVIERAQPEG